jgi:hemerythrin-like metal-binding protein
MSKKPLVSVGCASLDAQHKLLVALVENVVRSLRDGAPSDDYLKEVMDFRVALSAHFAAEQDQLHASHYKGLDTHGAKHAAVLQRIDESITALKHVSSTSARFAIITEIEDAIYFHELLDDTDYAGSVGIGDHDTGWDDSLCIGIDWVDEQHRQLFVMLDIFHLHAKREEWDMCRFVFRRLLDRVKTHFDNEDAYLKTLGAAAVGHRRHHFEALLSLENLLETADDAALKNIDVFVNQLLRSHILENDKSDLSLA